MFVSSVHFLLEVNYFAFDYIVNLNWFLYDEDIIGYG